MRILALCLLVALVGCKSAGTTSDVQNFRPDPAPEEPQYTVAHKLSCRVDVADGLSNQDRVDWFLFGDPAVSNAPVYWDSWGHNDPTALTVVQHNLLRCPGCYRLETQTGGAQTTFFEFQILQQPSGDTVLKVHSKTPVGGSPEYIPFGESDGVCRAVEG